MTRRAFTGCGTALVTPFTRTGAIDDAALRRLVRRQVEAGVHFLVPCGTTGENPTLTRDERRHLVELVVDEAAGRAPVLAGAGGYDTREVMHTAADMARAGATGLLSVTPYYNKPTPDGLYEHFRAIAGATDLPIILYNVPGRTGCNLDVATLVRIAAVPHVAGVKEASGNMAQICEICRAVPPGFLVLSGDDALTLPLMAVGGHGVVSVISNEMPSDMVALVEAVERHDLAAARASHHRLLPLMLGNFIEANPVPVKATLAMMGLIEEVYRLPLVPSRPATRERLRQLLVDLGVQPAGAPVVRAAS